MDIATWNINGVKARLETAARWLQAARPDIVLLQETKSEDPAFPRDVFEDLGYNVAIHGQKGFNGVAILSKLPLEDVSFRLPGDEADDHARFIEAVVSLPWGALRVASLYLPNGNPVGSDKFAYKLAWTERLHAWAELRLRAEETFVMGGDYNIIPEPRDTRFPSNWTSDALFQPEPRAAWRRLVHLGLTDALRASTPNPGVYTFWDYQAGAWQKDNGIRIDHFLLSPQAADRLEGVAIDREPRGWDKPSDHVPVIVRIAT
ncbi:MAG: exodeoxyribonuclease III [Bauldia sp.]|nr:exodeoxyribonuclease III [Bauldia sp.]